MRMRRMRAPRKADWNTKMGEAWMRRQARVWVWAKPPFLVGFRFSSPPSPSLVAFPRKSGGKSKLRRSLAGGKPWLNTWWRHHQRRTNIKCGYKELYVVVVRPLPTNQKCRRRQKSHLSRTVLAPQNHTECFLHFSCHGREKTQPALFLTTFHDTLLQFCNIIQL